MLSPLGMAAVNYARRNWRVIPLHHVREYGKARDSALEMAAEDTMSVDALTKWLRKWEQVPVCGCYKREECRTPGKHPQIKDWREIASSDPVLVAQWWRAWPRANVGLVTGGLARLVAIDIDGQIGRESLAALEQVHGPLPETLRQTTGREGGGEHFLFIVDDDFEMDKIRNRTKMAPGIDVRAEGGLIVAAPSIHPTGAQYTWRDASVPVASMPAWLIKIATSQKARQTSINPNGGRPTEAALEADGWPYGRRRTNAYQALLKAEPAISKRNGHGTCLKATILLIRGWCLTPEHAFDLLWQVYNPVCTPAWSPDELMHKIESAEYAVSDESYPWRFMCPAPDLSSSGRCVQLICDEGNRELDRKNATPKQQWTAGPDVDPATLAEEPEEDAPAKPKRNKRNTKGNVA